MNLDGLNDCQKRAVKQTEGPVLIIAGAGSGKTRVLTNRIAYLIDECGISPYNILAITFTNKAAAEMRERVEKVTDCGSQVWVSTFHSTCVRILRRYIDRIGYQTNFTIYDTDDQKSVIRDACKKLNIDTKMLKERTIMSAISSAKDEMISPDEMEVNAGGDYNAKRIAGVYREYQKTLKANNALDFDDLIFKTVELLNRDEEVLEAYQERFRYIMVDEYQDTNTSQFRLISKLAQKYGNLCVVGDDDQSIYKFRGANIGNILNFENTFPGAKVIKLEQNYRSTQNIVNAANSIIAKNDRQIPKHVFSENDEGDRVKVLKAYTDQEEAYLVADLAKREGRENGGRWNEIAVLYRNNSQSRAIEDALRRRDVPYRIYSGHSFYDRKEIKDLVAYFRLIVNPRDNEALRRIINTPARGIGAVTVARVAAVAAERGVSMWEVLEGTGSEQVPELKTAAKKLADFTGLIRSLSLERSTKPLHEFGLEVATRSGLIGSYRMNPSPESENALENINELLSSMQNFKEERIVLAYEEDDGEADAEPTVEEWLQNISLMTDMDKEGEDSKNRVVLMTVHSAKGLEFDTVFIVGVEENLFPSLMSATSQEKLEEERRLFYVAVTRARKKAFVSFARQRFKWGNTEFCSPSRFITEMDERYVDLPADMDEESAENSPASLPKQRQERYRPERPAYGNRAVSGTGGSGHPERPASPAPRTPHIAAAPPDTRNMKSMGSRRPAQEGETTPKHTVSASRYAVGMRVEHAKFGRGEITNIEELASDMKITVIFDDGTAGRKSLLSRYANLKIID